MSVSGYVPCDYKLIVENKEKNVEIPSKQVVNGVVLSRAFISENKITSVPCILSGTNYSVTVNLNTSEIKGFFTGQIKPEEISILFYERVLKSGVPEKSFTSWDNNLTKSKTAVTNKVEVANDVISATLSFSIKKEFSTKKRDSVLLLGIKIQNVVIRNLICDIVVLTNSKQITPDYKISIGKILTNQLLKSTFWATQEHFCQSMPDGKRKSKDSSEKNIENNSISLNAEESNKKMTLLNDKIAEAKNEMPKLLEKGKGPTENEISMFALDVLSAESIIPEQLMSDQSNFLGALSFDEIDFSLFAENQNQNLFDMQYDAT